MCFLLFLFFTTLLGLKLIIILPCVRACVYVCVCASCVCEFLSDFVFIKLSTDGDRSLFRVKKLYKVTKLHTIANRDPGVIKLLPIYFFLPTMTSHWKLETGNSTLCLCARAYINTTITVFQVYWRLSSKQNHCHTIYCYDCYIVYTVSTRNV